MTSNIIKEYWEKATPMSFSPEKWDYEQKRKFRYDLQDYMHKAFKFDKWEGKKVLEIGCGSGIDSCEFARNGALVTAIDITENAAILTKELSIEAGVNITVLQAPDNPMASLPFENNTFDLAYSYGVLHHIPQIKKALEEIQRVLKPNGKIMVMLYHKDSLLYAYSILYLNGVKKYHPTDGNELILNNTNNLLSTYSERNEGCPYTRAYTKKEAIKLFSEYFTDIEVSVHYNVLDLPGQRKVKFEIDDKWELGWHLVVKGRKA